AGALTRAVAVSSAVQRKPRPDHICAGVGTVARSKGSHVVTLEHFVSGLIEKRVDIDWFCIWHGASSEVWWEDSRVAGFSGCERRMRLRPGLDRLFESASAHKI